MRNALLLSALAAVAVAQHIDFAQVEVSFFQKPLPISV